MNTTNIHKKIALTSSIVLAFSLFAGLAHGATFAQINSQLEFGSRGNDVISLQTFLASNSNIYPEGIISGYYGTLTKRAVTQFQLHYGLPPVGRVGPMTMAKINSVIAAGYGIDVYAPTIYNTSVQKTSNSAQISWNTTESARGKVFYSASPFLLAEATGSLSEPMISGGSVALATNIQSSQSVTIPGLMPNKLYYYMIVAADNPGNVSVTNQSSFITNP